MFCLLGMHPITLNNQMTLKEWRVFDVVVWDGGWRDSVEVQTVVKRRATGCAWSVTEIVCHIVSRLHDIETPVANIG